MYLVMQLCTYSLNKGVVAVLDVNVFDFKGEPWVSFDASKSVDMYGNQCVRFVEGWK